jgi:hypothetical protein
MGLTVLIVPEAMAPELRRYIAHNGRTYTTKPFTGSPPRKLPRPPLPLNLPDPTMPSKKPESDQSQSMLAFTIETFDEPETGEPTQHGRFSRNWQDEEALDMLVDQLEAGRVTNKQALMQAGSHDPGQPGNPELHCQPAVCAGFAERIDRGV